MSTFQNSATLTFRGKSISSNTVTGEFTEPLTGSKTAPIDVYFPGDRISYVINLLNGGSSPLSDLTVTDDLGITQQEKATVPPLDYVDGSAACFIGGVPQAAPSVTVESGTLVFTGISVPADGNTTLVYTVTVNDYAPLGTGACITNTATVTGGGIVTPLALSATINFSDVPTLSIVKELSPEEVSGGEPLTYTFTLQNYGAVDVQSTDDAIVTDTFDPQICNPTVTFNGAPWTEGTNYTYADGTLTTLSGMITVPAATFSQNEDGTWEVTPGVSTLTVTGTI